MHTNAKMAGAAAAAVALAVLGFILTAPGPAAPPAAPAPVAFVPSMEGTRPDGNVGAGADGQLVVDAELGHLFDYYLAGLGERDLAAITTEIERELERRLKPGPAAQAKRLLASYLAYKRALLAVEQALPPEADMVKAARARLAAMQKLRASYFSAADSAGLFGARDAYDADAIARIALAQDNSLTPAQREAKLAALDAKLSPAMLADRAAPGQVMRTEETARRMREQGASADAVFQMRSAAISPEAARRLGQLDQEEAAWQARIASYQGLRADLLKAPAGDAQQLEARLQQLRAAHFTVEEQRRLGAYE
ncbi:lipase secretion chaperone [Massilia glaciei]|uniref:Lipase helper protein n=1 Tax=Massilia glaciei TaxID=1524097 RepID=A0A2U2HE86_9BURK|nr:lipase secretion chaperone [Massilia glaciei]PWF41735.1 lipase chaperone [Massilia glaciei]